LLIGPTTSTLRVTGKIPISKFTATIEADFLLLEGFKMLDIPRFWCIGESLPDEQFSPRNVKAYVLWDGAKLLDFPTDVPVLKNSEIDVLVSILKTESVDYSTIDEI